MQARTERHSLALVRHPDSEASALTDVTAHVQRHPGALVLEFVAGGDVRHLALADPSTFRRADEPWRHTCFEAFVESVQGEGYCEYNLSSSNEWAAYVFSGYRVGMRPIDGRPIHELSIERSDEVVVVRAMIESPYPDSEPLIMGLSMVEEDSHGKKSYWALAHMEDGPPDFHHPIGFDFPLFALDDLP